jgi:hypothetical protein
MNLDRMEVASRSMGAILPSVSDRQLEEMRRALSHLRMVPGFVSPELEGGGAGLTSACAEYTNGSFGGIVGDGIAAFLTPVPSAFTYADGLQGEFEWERVQATVEFVNSLVPETVTVLGVSIPNPLKIIFAGFEATNQTECAEADRDNALNTACVLEVIHDDVEEAETAIATVDGKVTVIDGKLNVLGGKVDVIGTKVDTLLAELAKVKAQNCEIIRILLTPEGKRETIGVGDCPAGDWNK